MNAIYEEQSAGNRSFARPGLVVASRLTLELVTVGDFALPVAGLFVQVKGQSAGARDLLQAGLRAPVRAGTERKTGRVLVSASSCLLSSWSQFFTFVFQSQVCLSMSNASPVGQRTVANLVTPISLALSHLRSISRTVFSLSCLCVAFSSSSRDGSLVFQGGPAALLTFKMLL